MNAEGRSHCIERLEREMHMLSVGGRRPKKQSSSLLKSVHDIYPRFPNGRMQNYANRIGYHGVQIIEDSKPVLTTRTMHLR